MENCREQIAAANCPPAALRAEGESRVAIPQNEEERIRLIGELLCKGIQRSPAFRQVAGDPLSSEPLIGEPEARILDYLRRHQSAAPKEIAAVLGLSRTRTYFALQRLIGTGQIVHNGGRTSATAYQLVDPTRN